MVKEEDRELSLQLKRGATGATACGGVRRWSPQAEVTKNCYLQQSPKECAHSTGINGPANTQYNPDYITMKAKQEDRKNVNHSGSPPELHCGSIADVLGPSGPNVIAQLPCCSCQALRLACPCRTNLL